MTVRRAVASAQACWEDPLAHAMGTSEPNMVVVGTAARVTAKRAIPESNAPEPIASSHCRFILTRSAGHSYRHQTCVPVISSGSVVASGILTAFPSVVAQRVRVGADGRANSAVASQGR